MCVCYGVHMHVACVCVEGVLDLMLQKEGLGDVFPSFLETKRKLRQLIYTTVYTVVYIQYYYLQCTSLHCFVPGRTLKE